MVFFIPCDISRKVFSPLMVIKGGVVSFLVVFKIGVFSTCVFSFS